MNTFLLFFYNRNMKKIYRIILSIYFITLMIVVLRHFEMSIFISLILLIPLFYIKNNLYRVEYLSYIYLTQVLGTTCHFYNLPYYDKCMHFLSGMIFVMIAYILLKDYISHQKILFLFMNCIEATVAFLWEVFEYCGLVFFNHDASRHFTTGIHDTMQDMIFSFIAGLLISFVIYKCPSYIDNLYKSPRDNPAEVSQQSHI